MAKQEKRAERPTVAELRQWQTELREEWPRLCDEEDRLAFDQVVLGVDNGASLREIDQRLRWEIPCRLAVLPVQIQLLEALNQVAAREVAEEEIIAFEKDIETEGRKAASSESERVKSAAWIAHLQGEIASRRQKIAEWLRYNPILCRTDASPVDYFDPSTWPRAMVGGITEAASSVKQQIERRRAHARWPF